MKIGIDVHGVIDTYPESFSILTKIFIERNIEIHIVTGAQKTETLINKLKDWNIFYNHFFSISDYLIKNNVHCNFKDPNNPWFDEDIWIKQKGLYAKRIGLDIHYDDMIEYKEYFPSSTTYLLVSKNQKNYIQNNDYCSYCSNDVSGRCIEKSSYCNFIGRKLFY